MASPLVLGLDASTQSFTAVLVERASGRVVLEHSLAYPASVWAQSLDVGKFDQVAMQFVATFEQLLADLKAQGADLAAVERIGVSAQQHGCAFLGPSASALLSQLRRPSSRRLVDLVDGLFSHDRCPIWMTSDTVREASELRLAAGAPKP